MHRNWIVTGMAALLAITASALAKQARTQDYDDQVKYAQLPPAVKATVDKERGRHELTSCWHVMRGGKEFYRVVIDTKGDDRVIRLHPGGGLMTAQDVADVHAAQVHETPARDIRLATGETNAVHVDWNRCPGPVRTEIGALAKGQEVHQVIRYESGGRTWYRATVGEGPYVRYIRVSEGGRVLNVRGDIDPGKAIAYDRCPGEVKRTIGAAAKSGKVEEVYEYNRGGKAYYQAQVEDKDGKHRFVTVDGAGKEVAGLPQ